MEGVSFMHVELFEFLLKQFNLSPLIIMPYGASALREKREKRKSILGAAVLKIFELTSMFDWKFNVFLSSLLQELVDTYMLLIGYRNLLVNCHLFCVFNLSSEEHHGSSSF